MRAGLLDRKVTIQAPTEARGTYGEVLPGWSDFAVVWAQKKQTGGDESFAMGETAATARGSFLIRYLPGVTAKMRLVDDAGVDWRISSVEEGGRREWLTLKVEAPSV